MKDHIRPEKIYKDIDVAKIAYYNVHNIRVKRSYIQGTRK
jgi:hypothetical protein